MRKVCRIGLGVVWVPGGQRYRLGVVVDTQLKPLPGTRIRRGGKQLLIYTGMAQGRQENKMLLPNDLDIDVLHGITVECRHRSRVAYPEVDGFGLPLEGYTRKRDVFLSIGKE